MIVEVVVELELKVGPELEEEISAEEVVGDVVEMSVDVELIAPMPVISP